MLLYSILFQGEERKMKLVMSGDMDDFLAEEQDPDVFELREAVQIAINKLSEPPLSKLIFRYLVKGYFFEGLTLEEIHKWYYQPLGEFPMSSVSADLETSLFLLREMYIPLTRIVRGQYSWGRHVLMKDFL
ncbi:MAG: hypothetical protein V1848_02910 [Candidatus Magasanikbacteria bacterium]